MKNTFGSSVTVTLFGESHSSAVGAVLDGIAPGIAIKEDFIRRQLEHRRPVGQISTSRKEQDRFRIISGASHGKTTGTPLTVVIPNEAALSGDYEQLHDIARPGHADYTAQCKYHGYQDQHGGGHFSGRVTAALTAVGAIAITALQNRNIFIGTHIKRCAGIEDRDFGEPLDDIALLSNRSFAVLDDRAGELMQREILAARCDCDSVGGVLETIIVGVPAGIGEPWFDSLESVMSHMLFSIPAVKGVSFGRGFDLAEMRGSEANDPFYIENDTVVTKTNNNGGINGGISNGMPLQFSCAIKPTPSIFLTQKTVNFAKNQDTKITIQGRHDPAIVHRARTVVDSAAALVLCDVLAGRYGTDYLMPEITN